MRNLFNKILDAWCALPPWYWIFSTINFSVWLFVQFIWIHSPVAFTMDFIFVLVSVRMYHLKTWEQFLLKRIGDNNDDVVH